MMNTRELVNQACEQMKEQNIKPTVERIRNLIGRGSNTTINDQLRIWLSQNRNREAFDNAAMPNIPDYLVKANQELIEQANTTAKQQFEAEKAGYQEEIVSLRNLLEEMSGANNALQLELSDIRQKKEAMESELLSFKNKEQAFIAEIEAAKAQIREMKEELEKKDEILQHSNATYKEAIDLAEERIRAQEKRMLMEISLARDSVKSSISESRILVQNMEDKKVIELAGLQRKINDLMSQNAILQGKLTYAEEKLKHQRKTTSNRSKWRLSKTIAVTKRTNRR